MAQETAAEQRAIEGADSDVAVPSAPTAASSGDLASSKLLTDSMLWSALRAKRELEQRGEPLLLQAPEQSKLPNQTEAEAYIEAAGATRMEPVVTHVQLFFIVGVALVTMQLDLNAAVISFTLLFHLCRLAYRLGWTTFDLQDMQLEGGNKKKSKNSKSSPTIGVGDSATTTGGSGADGGLNESLLSPSADECDSDDDDAAMVANNCWIVLCGKCVSWCRSIMKEEVERGRRRSSINLLDGDGAGAEVRIARKGTIAGSIFNLCNCMLGVGVLALPSAFSRVGVVLGLVLLLSCAVRVSSVPTHFCFARQMLDSLQIEALSAARLPVDPLDILADVFM